MTICRHAAGFVKDQCRCGLLYQYCPTCEQHMISCVSCSREPKHAVSTVKKTKAQLAITDRIYTANHQPERQEYYQHWYAQHGDQLNAAKRQRRAERKAHARAQATDQS